MILFHTCTDKNYEDFIPLFCLSILLNIPDSKIEIGVEDSYELPDYLLPYEDRVKFYKYHRPEGVNASTIRYINNVTTKAEYVYITDIDIIYLDAIMVEQHLARMRFTGLPYCNALRPELNALTGLHFTKYDAYYPVNYEGIDIVNLQDEQTLFEIVRKRVNRFPHNYYRPVHGIHISPSRTIDTIPGYGVEPYKERWLEFYPKIKDIKFSDRIMESFKAINKFYEDN